MVIKSHLKNVMKEHIYSTCLFFLHKEINIQKIHKREKKY